HGAPRDGGAGGSRATDTEPRRAVRGSDQPARGRRRAHARRTGHPDLATGRRRGDRLCPGRCSVIGRVLLTSLALLQGALGTRVLARLWSTRGGRTIVPTPDDGMPPGHVSVIVPVLNERERLGPCLDGLTAQPGLV